MTEEPETRTQTYTDNALWHPNEAKGSEKKIEFAFPSDEVREVTVSLYNPSANTEIEAEIFEVHAPPKGERFPTYVQVAEGKAKLRGQLKLTFETAYPLRLVFRNTKRISNWRLSARVDIEAKFKTENTLDWLGKSAVIVKGPGIHKVYVGVEDDGQPFEEGAKITIDLLTGQVKNRLEYDEATKVFWEAVGDFGGASIGEGRRCSCECGCNRKLATDEVLRRKCFACDVDMHFEGAKTS